jgi:mRNA interferase MazF
MVKFSIVLVSFPFDDLSTTKVRPALCLTDSIGTYQHVILAFISSKVGDYQLPSDIIVNEKEPDFSETGLKLTSLIRLHRVATLPTELIRRNLGNLPERLHYPVYDRLMGLFKP